MIQESLKGGETILCDGFNVANNLKKNQFDMLSKYKIPFRFYEKGKYLLYNHCPIINLDAQNEIERIVFNDLDRDIIQLSQIDKQSDFYDSYLTILHNISKSENNIEIKLRPGTLLIFDNWRILHGRKSFEGPRKFVGCYFGRSEMISKYRILIEDSK